MAGIAQLIINNPFDEPAKYWSYDRQSRSHHLGSARILSHICL